MVVLNNLAAQATLNELNRNNNKLEKSLKKVASGMKLNTAGDGAAEYAISEKMNVRLRALEQDVSNAQEGKSLVRVAEGGIQNIIENLREMKAMALNSANDHNSERDREIIQKDFLQRMEEIDDIASTTNYNGKLLLDGRYAPPISAGTNGNTALQGSTVDEVLMNYTSYIDAVTARTDLPVTGATTEARPSGAASYTTDAYGNITVTSSGVLDIPANVNNLQPRFVTIKAQNVELTASSMLENTNIEVKNSNANIWVNNLSVKNAGWGIITNYGSNNKLMLLGRNTFTETNSVVPAISAGALTIYNGSASEEGTLKISVADFSDNPDHPTAAHGSGAGISGGVTIESGTIGITSALGAGIGGSCDETMTANVTINGGHVIAGSFRGAAAIGAGALMLGTNHVTSIGDITIGKDAIVDVLAVGGAGIGTSTYCLDNFSYGAGTGARASTAGNITIDTDKIRSYSVRAEALGSGDGEGGTLTGVDDYGMVMFADNEYNAVHGTITTAGGEYQKKFTDKGGVDRYHLFTGSKFSEDVDAMYTTETKKDSRPLIIHTGTKSNQDVRVFVNDMHSEAMGLNGAKVDPREAALAAIDKLDSAVNYALNENTRMGAYQTRLDFTVDNLIASKTNVQAADSVIRDADMAKEMAEYAKNGMLSQAAQSVLAQANQNSNSVLSLLR